MYEHMAKRINELEAEKMELERLLFEAIVDMKKVYERADLCSVCAEQPHPPEEYECEPPCEECEG